MILISAGRHRGLPSSYRKVPIVGGGGFNVIFDQDLDGRGGNKKRKDSVRYAEEMIIEHDLLDIWRIHNPIET